MWSRGILGCTFAIALSSCVGTRVYEDADASYVPEKGAFTVDRAENGAFEASLSGYYGDTHPGSNAIDQEFWNRAKQFCGGEVERLSDGLCVVHLTADAPDPLWNPGRCKREKFRCKART